MSVKRASVPQNLVLPNNPNNYEAKELKPGDRKTNFLSLDTAMINRPYNNVLSNRIMSFIDERENEKVEEKEDEDAENSEETGTNKKPKKSLLWQRRVLRNMTKEEYSKKKELSQYELARRKLMKQIKDADKRLSKAQEEAAEHAEEQEALLELKERLSTGRFNRLDEKTRKEIEKKQAKQLAMQQLAEEEMETKRGLGRLERDERERKLEEWRTNVKQKRYRIIMKKLLPTIRIINATKNADRESSDDEYLYMDDSSSTASSGEMTDDFKVGNILPLDKSDVLATHKNKELLHVDVSGVRGYTTPRRGTKEEQLELASFGSSGTLPDDCHDEIKKWVVNDGKSDIEHNSDSSHEGMLKMNSPGGDSESDKEERRSRLSTYVPGVNDKGKRVVKEESELRKGLRLYFQREYSFRRNKRSAVKNRRSNLMKLYNLIIEFENSLFLHHKISDLLFCTADLLFRLSEYKKFDHELKMSGV